MAGRRIAQIITILLLAALSVTGCRYLNPRERVVVIVGDKELYESDVRKAMVAMTGREDSLQQAQSYVDQWVRKQLKVREAENLYAGSNRDIDS